MNKAGIRNMPAARYYRPLRGLFLIFVRPACACGCVELAGGALGLVCSGELLLHYRVRVGFVCELFSCWVV